jgi:RNA polymerase sigma-70 factor (ECF subfamily)
METSPMDASPPHELDPLALQHARLQRLARALVPDPSSADDAVQDTWLAALTHGGVEARSTAWLRTVLLNFARQARRGMARRVERERRVARAEREPDSVSDALAVQVELARAVAALDEPYRTTVYERFYEGLAPRRIAARHGLPVKTVKSRLTRGLEALRARLDRDGGGRARWLAALAPHLGHGHAVAMLTGWMLMNSKWKLACAGLGLLAVAWSVFVWSTDGFEPAGTTAVGPTNSLAAPAPTANVPSGGESPRVALESTLRASDASSTPERGAAATVVGRVVRLDATAVGDVDVVEFAGPSSPAGAVVAHADRDGRFDCTPSARTRLFGVEDQRWTTVFAAHFWSTTARVQPTIVLAPRNELSGLVVEPDRRPIEGAEVTIELDADLRRDVGLPLDFAFARGWRASTDFHGAFEFASAPAARGELVVRSPKHREHREPLPEFGARGLEVVLEPLESPHAVVAGVVSTANGEPAADAWVALGNRSTQTDADGRFRLDVTATATDGPAVKDSDGTWRIVDDVSTLRAVKRGHLPATLALPPREELGSWPDAEHLVLRLGGEPLAIRGRVEDDAGRPIAGAKVEVAATTPFGIIKSGEHVAYSTTIEALLTRSGSDVAGETDETGHFELDGLLDRDYELVARDPRTMRRAEPRTVRAGAPDVVLRLAPCKRCGRVAGRVVSPSGEPLADVRIYPALPNGAASLDVGNAATTDAAGQFEFAALELDGLGFQITSETAFMTFFRALAPDEDPERLSLVLSRRAFVQVDLGSRPEFADAFVALDARGERVQTMQFMDAAIFFPERVEIVHGKSEVVAVEETCRSLVLYASDAEVTRISVAPKANETTIVRP